MRKTIPELRNEIEKLTLKIMILNNDISIIENEDILRIVKMNEEVKNMDSIIAYDDDMEPCVATEMERRGYN